MVQDRLQLSLHTCDVFVRKDPFVHVSRTCHRDKLLGPLKKMGMIREDLHLMDKLGNDFGIQYFECVCGEGHISLKRYRDNGFEAPWWRVVVITWFQWRK